MAGRPRILLVAEAVTLAHVARPVVLGRALDAARFDVRLAWDPRYAGLFPGLELPATPIRSIPPERFLKALAKGSPLYNVGMLRSYVQEDLRLLETVRPDLVVGDFRLSLAVSAPLAGVPYATVTNAYWGPFARVRFPVPELPLTRVVGVPLAQALFDRVRRLAFAVHAVPLNRVRREHGLPSLGFDLRRTYTHADHTLYADLPVLIPTDPLPASHRFLGPVPWSPPVPLPEWWASLPADRPRVYVNLGSSGRADLLPAVVEALGALPVTGVVATAGRVTLSRLPPNVRAAEYLPGDTAAAGAAVVVCNGGSPSTQQALAAGVPVLGIAGNLDQHLNMETVASAGVGIRLRSDRTSAVSVRLALERILREDTFRGAAERLAAASARYDGRAQFRQFVDEVLTGGTRPAASPATTGQART